jgi:hypothetical protein
MQKIVGKKPEDTSLGLKSPSWNSKALAFIRGQILS